MNGTIHSNPDSIFTDRMFSSRKVDDSILQLAFPSILSNGPQEKEIRLVKDYGGF
jgi:hypothetical protein